MARDLLFTRARYQDAGARIADAVAEGVVARPNP
jgi:hypothetical protein